MGDQSRINRALKRSDIYVFHNADFNLSLAYHRGKDFFSWQGKLIPSRELRKLVSHFGDISSGRHEVYKREIKKEFVPGLKRARYKDHLEETFDDRMRHRQNITLTRRQKSVNYGHRVD